MTTTHEGGTPKGDAIILGGGPPIRPKKPKPSRGGTFGQIANTVERVTAPPSTAVRLGARENLPPRKRPQRWVIERQRMLKRLGYGVVVDGDWGVRSQRAWVQLQATLRGSTPGRPVPPRGGIPMSEARRQAMLDGNQLRQRQEEIAETARRNRQGPGGWPALGMPGPITPDPRDRNRRARLAAAWARDEDKQRLARKHPDIAAAFYPSRSGRAKGVESVAWLSPQIRKVLEFDDIAWLIGQDLARGSGPFAQKVSYRTRKGGRVERVVPSQRGTALVQSWLRDRGHSGFNYSQWDEKTSLALQAEAKKARRAERERIATQLARQLYADGSIQQAFKDAGRPYLSPQQLTDAISSKDAGGQGRAFEFAQILANAAKGAMWKQVDVRYQAWREAVLASSPLFAALGGDQDTLPLSIPMLGSDALARARTREEYNAIRALERTRAEITAMKLEYAQKIADAGLPVTVQVNREGGVNLELGADKPWWQGALSGVGTALEAASLPATYTWHTVVSAGDFLLVNGVVGAANAKNFLDDNGLQLIVKGDATKSGWNPAYGFEAISASEALELGARHVDELPWWMNLLGETVVDPLNFVPLTWVGKPVKGVAKAAKGGYKAARSFSTPHPGLEANVWSSRIPGREASETVRGVADTLFKPITRAHEGFKRQLVERRDALNRVAAEVERVKLGNYEELDDPVLRMNLQKAGSRIEELMLAHPAIQRIVVAARHYGVDPYLRFDRTGESRWTIFGQRVQAALMEYNERAILARARKLYPDVPFEDWAMGAHGYTVSHPEALDFVRRERDRYRDFVNDVVMPRISDAVRRDAPVVWDEGGRQVIGEAGERFHQKLVDFDVARWQDRVESHNPNYGRVLAPTEYNAVLEASAEELLNSRITRDKIANADLWNDASDAGQRYREDFVRRESNKAFRELERHFLAPHDGLDSRRKWSDELFRRMELAKGELAGARDAHRDQIARLRDLRLFAGQYVVAAERLGWDGAPATFWIGRDKVSAKELRDYAARHKATPKGDEADYEAIAKKAALDFNEAAAGLKPLEPDDATAAGADEMARKVLRQPRPVMEAIRESLDWFLESDLAELGINEAQLGKAKAMAGWAEWHARQAGENVRELLESALGRSYLQTSEVVDARAAMDDLRSRAVVAHDEYRQLLEGKAGDVELVAQNAKVMEILRDVDEASNAYFTALFRTADPSPVRQVAQMVNDERAALAEAVAAGHHDALLLDRVLQVRQRRLEAIAKNGAAKRKKWEPNQLRQTGRLIQQGLHDAGRQIDELTRTRRAAEQLVRHFDTLDLDRVYDQLDRVGGVGYVDTRATVSAPRAVSTSHAATWFDAMQERLDEVDSFAWMLDDPELVVLPDDVLAELPDNASWAAQARAIREGADLPRGLVMAVKENAAQPEAFPSPVGAGDSPWALGARQPDLVPQDPSVIVDVTRGERDPRPSVDRRELVKVLRQERTLSKAAADRIRAKAMKREGLHFAAMKYADAQGARILYHGVRKVMALWKFAVLPLQLGWTVKNYIDNSIKMLLSGVRDPRRWINPSGKSFLEWWMPNVGRHVIRSFDRVYGTDLVRYWDAALRMFWQQSSGVLDRLIGAHGIEFPAELHKGYLADSLRVQGDDKIAAARGDFKGSLKAADDYRAEADALKRHADRLKADGRPLEAIDVLQKAAELRSLARHATFQAYTDAVWTLTAEAGEGWARRAVYSHFYLRELKRLREARPGLALEEKEALAVRHALGKVSDIVFDPTKAKVIEDNFAPIFPFVNFWRNNVTFWSKAVANDPWIVSNLDRWDDARAEAAAENGQPNYLERYFPATILNPIASLPGMDFARDALFKDGYFDPRNLVSIGVLWRAFKERNDLLTPEQGGAAFLGTLVGGLSDVGLGLAPWVRKPLEGTGLVDVQFWRDAFPQTTQVQALTAEYLNERWPDGFNVEAMLLDPLYKEFTGKSLSDYRKADFDRLVNREIAGQRLRGAPIDRAGAERKITDWFLAHTVWTWATNLYLRRITPEDAVLSKTAVDLGRDVVEFDELSPQLQRAYQLFKRRALSTHDFDRFAAEQGRVQEYYNLDPNEREAFLALNPGILPYITKLGRSTLLYGRRVDAAEAAAARRDRKVRNEILLAQTDTVMRLGNIVQSEQITPAMHQEMRAQLVTPELDAFWSKNDTPTDVRNAMLKGEYWEVIGALNRQFWSLPEGDFAAREAFLKAHPILGESWARAGVRLENGLPSPGATAEDLTNLDELAKRHFRDYYFALREVDGYQAAAEFLRRHPQMMEGTRVANRVSEVGPDAVWLPAPRGTARANLYLKAKPYLDAYGARLDKGDVEGARAIGDEHPVVYDYINLYGKKAMNPDGTLTAQGKAYRKVKPLLEAYYKLPKGTGERTRYAEAHPELLDYFQRFSRGGTNDNDRQSGARSWVSTRSRYRGAGRHARRSMRKDATIGSLAMEIDAHGRMGAEHQAIARRYEFWMRFFALDVDERADFVRENAADYGVFVYGVVGVHEQYEQREHQLAWSFAHGELSRQQAYLYAKPILDIFFTLDSDEQELFRQANPEVEMYLRLYARQKSLTGDAATDAAIRAYFDIPTDRVEDRAAFLEEHPAVATYFSAKRTPEERALGRLVETFFGLDESLRPHFLQRHPELGAFFEKRTREKDIDREIREAFDEADPRQAEWLDRHAEEEFYARVVLNKIQQRGLDRFDLKRRVDREFEPRERQTSI